MNSRRSAMGTLAVIASLATAPSRAEATPAQVGSKSFTESVVLGEVARMRLKEGCGLDAMHKAELGGSPVLFEALKRSAIDLYPEYTGTLRKQLLRNETIGDDDALRAWLRQQGLGMSESLGFQNGYALAVRRGSPLAKRAPKLSSLATERPLRVALSNEFFQREDGWPGLVRAYALDHHEAEGMLHAVAYRALAQGKTDIIDVYTTDAEIVTYDLRLLEDDRGFFPAYDAVFLWNLDFQSEHPECIEAIEALAGRISADAMRRANLAATRDGETPGQVAQTLLKSAGFRGTDEGARSKITARILERTWEHLGLVGYALGLAIPLAIPLGIAAARMRRFGQVLMAAVGVLQTLPSLALLVLLVPVFGIGATPAVIALALYALLPIVRNTQSGLVHIDPKLRESAEALGLSATARLRLVELPLASPSILAGLKTAAVIAVGTATLGALIGAGGYGQPILAGIRLSDTGRILEGALPAAAMALGVQGLFEVLERWSVPRGLRLKAEVPK